ncbi:hypothetical protein EP837_02682 [Sphingobium sp. EP60837]|nr:hypothetical protein EP837_02682 [Sphingobium sp. EP60837]
MPGVTPYGGIGIIGSGRVASALGLALADLSAAPQLGGVSVDIVEEYRPLSHAALCHGANHLVTLIAGSCEALAAAGVNDPASLLAPLARAALENSLAKGMAGLSGPLLRGDEESIAGHIAALRKGYPLPCRPIKRWALPRLTRCNAFMERKTPLPGKPCWKTTNDNTAARGRDRTSRY